jgi:hypothetical protein
MVTMSDPDALGLTAIPDLIYWTTMLNSKCLSLAVMSATNNTSHVETDIMLPVLSRF